MCVATIEEGADLWPVEREFLGRRCSQFCYEGMLHKHGKREVEVMLALGQRNADGLTDGTDCLKEAVIKLEYVGSGSEIRPVTHCDLPSNTRCRMRSEMESGVEATRTTETSIARILTA